VAFNGALTGSAEHSLSGLANPRRGGTWASTVVDCRGSSPVQDTARPNHITDVDDDHVLRRLHEVWWGGIFGFVRDPWAVGPVVALDLLKILQN
jgi:hypothetical protein